MDRFEGRLSLPVYRRTLEQACEKFPPPFGTAEYGDVYREAAADPAWLAVSLVTNAEHEGDGAQRLWSLTACTEDPAVAALLKQHAIDESNHAKIYLRMVDLVFDGAIEPGFRVQLDGVSPGYTRAMQPVSQEGSPFAHPITLDDLIQMNIAEIRTTIHHLLQRPMLRAHCPPDRRDKLVQLQNRLLREELRHVAYTAKLIEEHSEKVGRHAVAELFGERVLDFNEVTRAELERRVFDVT
jgi:rubrerythrin